LDGWVYGEGWQWIVPAVMGYELVDVRSKSSQVPNIQAITRDRVPLRPTAAVSFKVVDPALYLSAGSNIENASFPEAIGRHIIKFMKDLEVREVFEAQGHDLPGVRNSINAAIGRWGLTVETIQMTNITVPPEVMAEVQRQYQLQRVVEQQNLIKEARGLTDEQAAEFVQVERNKVSKGIQELRIPGLLEILERLSKGR
jgi:regulator of protease activity HflC (stomatin/prohibitin superfamily)